MKLKGNPISINKSQSSDLAKFLQIDYENKIRSLKEKISKKLNKKYHSLYSEKNYSLNQLDNDLNKMVKNINFNNFFYDIFLKEIEKAIINKLNYGKEICENFIIIKNSSPELRRRNFNSCKSGILSLNRNPSKDTCIQLNKIISKNVSSLNLEMDKSIKNLNINYEDNIETSASNNANKTIKLKQLKSKLESEWHQIVELDNLKAIEENRKKELSKKEISKKIVETLKQQILENNELIKKKKLEDKRFTEKIDEIKKNEDYEEKKRDEELRKKIIIEKKIIDQFYQEAKYKKIKEKKKEMMNDLKNLETIKKLALDDQIKKKKKKENEKETSLKLIEENNKNIQYLNSNKEKLREEKRSHFEEYSKILEQQSIERDIKEKKLKEKIKSQIEKVGDMTNFKVELIKRNMEEQKYLKDKAIKDNKYDELELKKIEKLKKLQENVLKTNDLILKEKNNKINKEKNDFSEKNRLAKSVDNYFSEMREYNQLMKEKNLKYQEDLQKQIYDRYSSNPFRMSENEKKLNSSKIQELSKLKENLMLIY